MAELVRLAVADTPASMPGISNAAPDRTATGKEHFEVLDGLRGTAAMLVVLFHIQGIIVMWDASKVILHHAVLAVDFFFLLSGFVIGYAYDDRWGRMTVRHFLRLRLVRLHPLVILGVVLGFASYLFDPFTGSTQAVPLGKLLGVFALGLLLLPAGPLPNRWSDTHPLNGPCWSLLQEYIGNVAYALLLRRCSSRALLAIAMASGIGLVACGLKLGSMDQGSGWDSLWMAPVRLCFPFVTGLWLYRMRGRLSFVRFGYLPLTVVLITVVAFPTLSNAGPVKLNGLYETGCIVLIFPLVILAGSHSEAGLGMMRLCKFAGRISYPIYMTHFPFLYIWMNFVANGHPTRGILVGIGLTLIPFLIAVAWASYTFWDEPIRARLRARLRGCH